MANRRQEEYEETEPPKICEEAKPSRVCEEARPSAMGSNKGTHSPSLNFHDDSSDLEADTTTYDVPMGGDGWHSHVKEKLVDDLQRKCQIPNLILLEVQPTDERASSTTGPGTVSLHVKSIIVGARFLLP